MLFYPSKTHDTLNRIPFNPELINGRVMLNPLHPAYYLQADTKALIDSGAFQELGSRGTATEALNRQLAFIQKVRAKNELADWEPEALCIYDQMAGVDEAIIDGKKQKIRGTYESAKLAVAETLTAAEVYKAAEAKIGSPIMYIAQGINPQQYTYECLVPMLDLMRATDYFGYGGFCIIGRKPKLKPVFYETLALTLPLLRKKGIKRIHLLGVCVSDCVRIATREAAKYGLTISTDSSSPEVNGAVFGKTFTREKWVCTYSKDQKFLDYHPHALAMQNITDYHNWVELLRLEY